MNGTNHNKSSSVFAIFIRNNGNTAIGILADSLFRASASGQWRQHLKANNLVLISPFYPEGRFTPANAMARNKFIYLLSSATVVVTSGEKGGTWEGAKENLKKDWVPLLVSAHKQPLQAGNQALINGDGLGKVQANACSISPDDTAEQLLALLSNSENVTSDKVISEKITSQQSNIESSKLSKEPVSSALNETGSLLTELDAMPSNADYAENSMGDMQAQDDLFSMAENEQESEPEQAVTSNEALQVEGTDVETSIIETKVIENSMLENDMVERNKFEEPNLLSGVPELPSVEHEQRVVNEIENSQSPEQTTEQVVEPESEQTPKQSTMPLLDSFYHQLCELITQQPKQLIDKTALDSHFPEFEIMGKQALDKWLKHLVEQGKLVRPSAKKKQFTLPLTSPTQATELVTKPDSETN